ncbi:hypothetical protein AB6A40_000864 [Gnathostoma spinigerum]|uniref:M-phase inducer phosphatase n=1 Tax=Gnathostoma spinigerum TaxID=75299 RepID=A0ABD6E3X5_9BILA
MASQQSQPFDPAFVESDSRDSGISMGSEENSNPAGLNHSNLTKSPNLTVIRTLSPEDNISLHDECNINSASDYTFAQVRQTLCNDEHEYAFLDIACHELSDSTRSRNSPIHFGHVSFVSSPEIVPASEESIKLCDCMPSPFPYRTAIPPFDSDCDAWNSPPHGSCVLGSSIDSSVCSAFSGNSTLSVMSAFNDEFNISMTDADSVFGDAESPSSSQIERLFHPVKFQKERKSLRRSQSFIVDSTSEAILMGTKTKTRASSTGDVAFSLSSLVRKRGQKQFMNYLSKKTKLAEIQEDGPAYVGYQHQEYTEGGRNMCKRIQSSSIVERGKYARLKDTPEFLEVRYSLPFLEHPQVTSGAFRSITADTLIHLMLSMSIMEFNEKYMLIDCRYPFEYNGGHIRGALNLHDGEKIRNIFFPDDAIAFSYVSKKVPIFYCEFSQKRGPTMAHALRACDRKRNELSYPYVDYKEIYLLDSGYKQFFSSASSLNLCEPNSYVTMFDDKHTAELREYSMHRSRSVCSLDCTISKRRPYARCRNRTELNRRAVLLKSTVSVDQVLDSPQEQESPTNFHESAAMCSNNETDPSCNWKIAELADQSPPTLSPLKKIIF